MSTIAVLADVHGNLPALEAVLADIAARRPDEVLVGGDLVGRGPQGRAIVEHVRALGWRSVRGNHEDYLLAFRRGEVPAEWWATQEWSAARWMAGELGNEAAAWAAALPFSLRSSLEPDLVLVHGTPRSNNAGLGPWTSARLLAAHLAEVPGSLLVCGHTHRPMARPVAGGLVVNVGSVGLPFNRDHRAQYALLRRHAGGWHAELRQVAYDLQRILAIYEESGFLEAGGVTARLLRLELTEAAPFLVPFLRWSAATGAPPTADRVADFLRVYDPDTPLAAFFRQLDELRFARTSNMTQGSRRPAL